MSSSVVVRFSVVALALIGAACSNGQPYVAVDGGTGEGGGPGGAGAAAGRSGAAGAAGHAASGGQAGGTAVGAGGMAGSAGGHGGSAGAGAAGGSGTGGTAGAAGTPGAGGTAGSGGTAGAGGVKGTGGTGTGGAGTGGASTGGTTGTGGAGGGAVSCSSTQHNCNNTCFDKTSIQACGTSCMPCQPPANATATCDGNACGFKCTSATQHACNGACVDNSSVQSCGTTSCQACPAVSGATATCDGTKCGYTCAGSTPHDCGGGVCVASTQCCSNTDCPTNAGGQTGTCDTGTHTCNYNCPSTGNSRSCTVNGTTTCIAPSGCCINSDCTGTCKVCNSSHVCVAATSEDDPNGRCAGTCDSSGACVSKKGQLCNTTSAGCISGTQCAPDGYCCDSLCSGPCVACDFQGKQGTCTALPSGSTTPHSGHGTCTGAGTTCGGSCDGSGSCSYPGSSCGSATCSGTSYTATGSCSMGNCVTPPSQTCAAHLVCGASACKSSCSTDADCVSGYFCETGSCHMAAVAVASGVYFSCALLADGRVFCWGDNSYGQFGNGAPSNSANPTPAQVPLSKPATAIACGAADTCAILSDGTAWCWGYNPYGTVGNGTFTTTGGVAVPSPVQVMGLPAAATAITLGYYHACAISGGGAYCWGYDGNGELGNGVVMTSSPTGVATATAVINLSAVTAISAGADHTCAIASGKLYCWGANSVGELGGGTTGSATGTPQSVILAAGTNSILSAGGQHTLLLYTSGTMYSWGENNNGQLGQGFFSTTAPKGTGSPGAVVGDVSAVAVSGGLYHSCSVNSDGSVACWGYDGDGELGNGMILTTGTSGVDQPGPVLDFPGVATAVAAGGDHTCALLKNGAVWCWGYNGTGELGTGNEVQSLVPVQVLGW